MIEIQYVVGDATEPKGDGPKIIGHIVNDVGAWGAGFVLALSRRWLAPAAAYRTWHDSKEAFELGNVQLVPVTRDIHVVNMIAQHGIRSYTDRPPIRYEALEEALDKLCTMADEKKASVHMPRIGCGSACGHWSKVEPLIIKTLCAFNVPVFVYDLKDPD